MSETVAATALDGVVERYIAAWNEPDIAARRGAVAELWTEDGACTDPLAAVEGHKAIEALIAGAREQFPGHVFVLSGAIDAHHDLAGFSWELVPQEGGEAVVIGFDVVVVTEDGRIRTVLGFLDKVPLA